MDFLKKLQKNLIVLDGGMGTLLQKAGLGLGELPESWNLTHPEIIEGIHKDYLNAGSDVIYANTFGANPFKFGEDTEDVITAGVQIAKRACIGYKNKFVALDIGSLGKLLKPLGDLDFEDAVSNFKRMVNAGVKAGADLVVIETMNDLYELKSAILAVKECCNLPIMVSCVFDKTAKTMTGASPETVTALAESMGVVAVGLNCSLAPDEMVDVVKRFLNCASIPVLVKPNAGLPVEKDGQVVYDVDATSFANSMKKLVQMGVRVVGGCCGTTPEYISRIKDIAKVKPGKIKNKNLTVISSYTNPVYFGKKPILIGERINPTGKKRLKQALKENDISYILGEGISQVEKGVHVLDVNVGMPEIDEPEMLTLVVKELQSVTDLPLQLDTSNPLAMERAMRIYNGKPLINSVNGKKESMDAIFPLVKKYGGAVICLTLDEKGIPDNWEDRVNIAKKIIKEASKYGISKKDLIFDTLAMAVSADANAPSTAINAISYLKCEYNVNTSLGVSNVSFGLPNRDFINSTFFAMALTNGLSCAIINPNSQEMIKTYKSFCSLSGYDENCLEYIEYASSVQTTTLEQATNVSTEKNADNSLKYYVEKGLKKEAEKCVQTLLQTKTPLEIIDGEIIPALDKVGKDFENKTLFLPQLLISAETASCAFEIIKSNFGSSGVSKRAKIVLATVKGDIHDIGKNIVKTLLENYGYTVYDLGKDVPPEVIVEKIKETNAQVVGLSALMTTTVSSMGETIKLIKESGLNCKTLVGGAVLTKEYADMLGADRYAKDAMDSVRFMEEIESKI